MATKQKIRIRLKAFDYKLIDQSAAEIVDTAKDVYKRQFHDPAFHVTRPCHIHDGIQALHGSPA